MASLRSALSSRFARQVFTLSAGSALSQAIPLAASPILTRIYAAEDYGVYVMVLAISAVLLTVSSLRFDAAILQVRHARQIKPLVTLGFLAILVINIAVALMIALGIAFAWFPAALAKAGYWLLAIPLLTTANAVQNLFIAINIREGSFRTISTATVQKAAASTVVQIALGWLGFGIGGLFAGSLAASLAANRRLISGKSELGGSWRAGRRRLAATARRFSDFPLYTMPGTLINSLALNSVVMLLGVQHSAHDVGQFGLAQRSVAGPLKTISDAVGQVFLQRASVQKDNPAALRSLYLKTALMLATVAIAVLLPVSFWLEEIFAFVFGSQWRLAGSISTLLLPLIGIRFVVSPISGITNFRGMNAFGMVMQIAILLGILVSFWLAYAWQLDLLQTVRIYTAIGCLTYVAFGILGFAKLRDN